MVRRGSNRGRRRRLRPANRFSTAVSATRRFRRRPEVDVSEGERGPLLVVAGSASAAGSPSSGCLSHGTQLQALPRPAATTAPAAADHPQTAGLSASRRVPESATTVFNVRPSRPCDQHTRDRRRLESAVQDGMDVIPSPAAPRRSRKRRALEACATRRRGSSRLLGGMTATLRIRPAGSGNRADANPLPLSEHHSSRRLRSLRRRAAAIKRVPFSAVPPRDKNRLVVFDPAPPRRRHDRGVDGQPARATSASATTGTAARSRSGAPSLTGASRRSLEACTFALKERGKVGRCDRDRIATPLR